MKTMSKVSGDNAGRNRKLPVQSRLLQQALFVRAGLETAHAPSVGDWLSQPVNPHSERCAAAERNEEDAAIV